MRLRNARYEAMQTQAPQVVRHLTGGNGLGRFPQQGSPVIAEFAVGESPWQKPKHQQGAEQRLHHRLGET